MSAQQSKALVRRLFEEVWSQDKTGAAKEIIHDDYKSSENITFDSVRGLKLLAAEMKFYRDLYSDMKFKIERMFTQGETVVTVWEASGVANHEVFTSRSGKVVNKSLRAKGISLSRVADGKIIENTFYWPRDPLFP
ncbi:MAG: hypothetical protein QOG71_1926 [Pyrinomonadaceae bacterium]|jgi:ketosteroid isomerase-like protein|nr:hypothetical protein [Pyrinomonadaceae bacterium]MDQ1591299.1 hypothetical protein [Pyrinomonadaceae bacterium]MDX6272229.1 hypothetical protein [Acidobacteriota bacterium]